MNGAAVARSGRTHGEARKRSPGFLITSHFGWASGPIATMADTEPCLYEDLFALSPDRMHLTALVLAHIGTNAPLPRGSLLLRGRIRDVIAKSFGRPVIGIRRLLACLPMSVMERDSYRDLVSLLNDFPSATILYHADTICEPALRMLHGAPAPLRKFVFALSKRFPYTSGLTEGLRLIASRRNADLDTLVAVLAKAGDLDQFVSRIENLVDSMPLPDMMPPPQVGPARRLDETLEIRVLGKRWKNCADDYAFDVNLGTHALYLWAETAMCLVQRRGRFGWFLEEVKGPRNSDVESETRRHIFKTFEENGIPATGAIGAIESILRTKRRGLLWGQRGNAPFRV